MYTFLVVLSFAIRDFRVEATPVPPTAAPVFDRDLKVKAVGRLILSKLGLEQPPVVSDEQLKSVSASLLTRYDLTAKMNERTMAERALRRKDEDQYYSSRMTTVDVKELTCKINNGTNLTCISMDDAVCQCHPVQIPVRAVAKCRANSMD